MLAYEPVASKYIYQDAHMRRLINAFAIKLAVPFAFLWVNVHVYVSQHSMLGCLSFRAIKEKKSLVLINN